MNYKYQIYSTFLILILIFVLFQPINAYSQLVTVSRKGTVIRDHTVENHISHIDSSRDMSDVDNDYLDVDSVLVSNTNAPWDFQVNIFPPLLKLQINSGFGIRRHPILKRKTLHAGIDLKANYDPVIAIADGVVKKAAYGNREGFFIVIDHGNGIESVYCHLSVTYFTAGENVTGGNVIGISGATGAATGPHLHFGIKEEGRFVDPIDFLKMILDYSIPDNY